MSDASTNLSSGLDRAAEELVNQEPTEPFWSENLLFAMYDPASDLGFWLHLGTVPNDWTMWEERVLVMLPAGEGSLTMWSFHRTASARRPAGSNLEFRCLDPFRRWSIFFDGYAVHTTDEQMVAGTSPPGPRRRLRIDVDVGCVNPVWDAGAAVAHRRGAGAMATQGWAKEHYEQLFEADGTVFVDDQAIPFSGTGWRDHSRGPRGGNTGDAWGGHVIMGALFASGRSFIMSRYWTPDGRISLEGAGVVAEDGCFHYAEVKSAPRLDEVTLFGEKLDARLEWDGGVADLTGVTQRSLWTPMRKKYAAAIDMTGSALNYAINFSRITWEGEQALAYSERSDMLNSPAPDLWHEEERE